MMVDETLYSLAHHIKQWGHALGFSGVGITDIALDEHDRNLQDWLRKNYHGDMAYMARSVPSRTKATDLLPEALRAIMVRMPYLPEQPSCQKALADDNLAYIARYAVGRDYHKVMRKRLQKLADHITAALPDHRYRVFVDSAPVMEKPLAEKAGLGWIGKHTLLLDKKAGSWFFLGGLYTNLPLPIDPAAQNVCGSCSACLRICPTQAIVAPYQLDARRCIAYLTIEHRGAIPLELRPLIGNRVFGCDDCQLICPWNRYAQSNTDDIFKPRRDLLAPQLLSLFTYDEATFLKQTEGSAIRRVGYQGWLRNIAVALGNASFNPLIIAALQQRQTTASPLVQEHIDWALQEQQRKARIGNDPMPATMKRLLLGSQSRSRRTSQ